jgi:large subunit ribosomal protein L25
MAKEIKLSASKREVSGTSASKVLRRAGVLPAVVYGENGARSIQIDRRAFDTMLKHHTSENLIVDLSIDNGEVIKALLREVQHEAVMGGVLHADFVEVSMTRAMRVTIPIVLKGEPVGVSQQSGILEQVLRELAVECLPGDLVESFDLDVSNLALGHTLMVRDLKLDSKFTIITSGDVAVATVVAPREEAATEAATGEEGAAAQPEVIGKKKEEGEAAEGAAAKGAAGKEEPKKDAKKEPKKK